MQTRAAYRESEIEARRRLVKVAAEMLEGRISFLEGSTIICGLENSIGGVTFPDEDFIVFDLIADERTTCRFQNSNLFGNRKRSNV